MQLLFRAYAFLFEILVSLALIALSVLAMTGDTANFRLPMLPWEGVVLARATLILGIVGLVAVLLAMTRAFRAALPVWALVVFILLFRGWFASSYAFANGSGFYSALAITVAALLAFLLSFSVFGRRAQKL